MVTAAVLAVKGTLTVSDMMLSLFILLHFSLMCPVSGFHHLFKGYLRA